MAAHPFCGPNTTVFFHNGYPLSKPVAYWPWKNEEEMVPLRIMRFRPHKYCGTRFQSTTLTALESVLKSAVNQYPKVTIKVCNKQKTMIVNLLLSSVLMCANQTPWCQTAPQQVRSDQLLRREEQTQTPEHSSPSHCAQGKFFLKRFSQDGTVRRFMFMLYGAVYRFNTLWLLLAQWEKVCEKYLVQLFRYKLYQMWLTTRPIRIDSTPPAPKRFAAQALRLCTKEPAQRVHRGLLLICWKTPPRPVTALVLCDALHS